MKAYGITDKGAVRIENQDDFRFELNSGDDTLCAVLCDGMGGALAGSIASAMAVDAFMLHAGSTFKSDSSAAEMKSLLREAVNYANLKVYDRSFTDFSCMGMGCTLVGLLINNGHCLLANVGDSRAYLLGVGEIRQISRDHSLVEEMVAKGELSHDEARNHPQKNIITRAIGVEASVKCDVFEFTPESGSRILLCSDGLSNVLTDREILSLSESDPDLATSAEAMMKLALDRGAPDNVTVLIAQL